MKAKQFYSAAILLLFLVIGIQTTHAIDIPGDDSYYDIVNGEYVLNQDIIETITIKNDYITLDGGGCMVDVGTSDPGIYLEGREYVTIKNVYIQNCERGIVLVKSNEITLINNTTVSSYFAGIHLQGSSDNEITGNITSNNHYGILLMTDVTSGIETYSTNNTISGNTFELNDYGISFSYSSYNEIYNNNFINNDTQVCFEGISSNNVFFDLDTSSGNYWSDYEGLDTNCDGIGDTETYIFTGGEDLFPWVDQDGWLNANPDPESRLANLIGMVADLNLQNGINNSLDAKLQNALDALEASNAGQRQDAINKMQAFINAVEAQSGDKIPESDADVLIAVANCIIYLL